MQEGKSKITVLFISFSPNLFWCTKWLFLFDICSLATSYIKQYRFAFEMHIKSNVYYSPFLLLYATLCALFFL